MDNRRLLTILGLFLIFTLIPADAAADTLYTIQPGDTLYAISLRFGVSIQEIAAANNLVNPNIIYAGQTLIIPDGSTDAGGQTQTPVPVNQPSNAAGGIYTVQPGDTLYQIALRFGVTVQEIVQANDLFSPHIIYPGQTLIIPGAGQTTSPAPPPSSPAPPTASPPGINLLPNPSFEEGYSNLFGAPELQVPSGWQLEIDEGPSAVAPETGLQYLRPESRLATRWSLPPNEQPLFIVDGNQTLKVFKGGAPASFRLFTDLNLEPGTYRFTARFFADLVANYGPSGKIWSTQPLAGEALFLGPGGAWVQVTPGQQNALTYTFTVNSAGTFRIGMAFRTRYALANNGFFIDGWSLEKL